MSPYAILWKQMRILRIQKNLQPGKQKTPDQLRSVKLQRYSWLQGGNKLWVKSRNNKEMILKS